MSDPDRTVELEGELKTLEKDRKGLEREVMKSLEAIDFGAPDHEAEVAAAEVPQIELEARLVEVLEELTPLQEARVLSLEAEIKGASDEDRDPLKKDLAGHQKALDKGRVQLVCLRLKKEYASIRLLSCMKDQAWEAMDQFRAVRVCAPGTTFVNQGDYTGEFCVILEGLISAYRQEPGKGQVKLGTLGAGQWFGEMSAMSNQPAMATVRAEQRCVVLGIDPPLFKILYSQNAFKQRIDAKYRERALAVHLRAAPLLKGISEEKLLPLQDEAELVVIEEGEVVAREGDVAEGLFLIRTGSIMATKSIAGGGARTVAYLKDNSSFGERSLASEDRQLHVTFTAMERTDVVKIPAKVIESIYAKDEETLQTIIATADAILAAEEGRLWGVFDFLGDEDNAGQVTRDRLDLMVSKQSVKGGEALVIDLQKCTRCNACVESCVAVHEDRVPRLSKSGNRISIEKVLTTACYNCETPGCMSKCNDGAIRRDVKGSIQFIWDNCTGCTACITGCPYGVIRMADLEPAGAGDESPFGGPTLLAGIPFFGRLFAAQAQKKVEAEKAAAEAPAAGLFSARTGRENKRRQKAIKCDLCAGLPFEACVYNCPCGAIERFNPEAIFGEMN